ncbi:MAG: Flp family type IVb pilin [Parvularculaceae bacterium]
MKLNRLLGRFVRDDSGATAIEYGLIVALIFLAVVTSVNSFADNTNDMYSEITSALSR